MSPTLKDLTGTELSHSQRLQQGLILLAIVGLSGIVILPTVAPSVHAQATPSPSLFLSPTNRTLAPLYTLVTYNVTVANIPASTPLGAWDIIVAVTDTSVLLPVKIDLVQTFGGTAVQSSNCINTIGLGCGGTDSNGVAHSAATSYADPTVCTSCFPSGNVTLFTVTFNSTASSGYTSIRLQPDQAATTAPLVGDIYFNPIPVGVPAGATYGDAASAPVAIFSWTPEFPYARDLVTFNASLSYDPSGGQITLYDWGPRKTTVPTTTLVFASPGNQSVTLLVTACKNKVCRQSLPDTQIIVVRQRSTIDLNLNGLSLSEYNYIHPGDKLLVTATVFNNGTTTVNAFNVTLRLDNQVIAVLQNTGNVTLNQYANLKYNWDTTNIRPSSYTLSATASILTGDNNTSDKYLSVDIRFIEFQGSTLLGVGLVPFGGLLTIIILGGGITAYSLAQRSARKRRAQQEAL